MSACKKCNGKKQLPMACHECKGNGYDQHCPACKGTGRVPCSICKEQGKFDISLLLSQLPEVENIFAEEQDGYGRQEKPFVLFRYQELARMIPKFAPNKCYARPDKTCLTISNGEPSREGTQTVYIHRVGSDHYIGRCVSASWKQDFGQMYRDRLA